MAELYGLSSQNSDFTVLKEEGFVGLNFAFTGVSDDSHG
jgi:hypothetical protein